MAEVIPVMTNNYEDSILKGVQVNSVDNVDNIQVNYLPLGLITLSIFKSMKGQTHMAN